MATQKTTIDYLEDLVRIDSPYFLIGEYINNCTPIEHECPKGHRWNVRPSNILSGKGCPYCSGKKKKTTQEYQKELDSLNKGYTVLEEYVNNKTKLKHSCSKGHEWYVVPKDLVGIKKTNCPYCVSRYLDYDNTAYLYYIKILDNQKSYYKVGITKNTIEERYKGSDLKKIKVLLYKEYDKGWKAAEQEKEILREFKDYIFQDQNLLNRGGKGSEIFSVDVLQLDRET